MRNIIFSRNPELIEIPAGSAVCIYHKHYTNKLPKVANCTYLEFGYVADNFQNMDFFAGKDTVVFVGANKFFTPSTRFHPVFEILQYGLPGMKRYSIDIAPYVGPIWRLWTHFSFAGVQYGDYTYSYLLESHYNSYLDGARDDNPMSLDKIRKYAEGHVLVEYERFFSEPKVAVVRLPAEVHKEYQALKEELFEKHDKIAPIIKGLADFASAHCPARKIPREHQMFDQPDDVQIIRTDLKVDEYLTNNLLEKMREVNRVVEVLRS